jgi:dienelactone hydrolase
VFGASSNTCLGSIHRGGLVRIVFLAFVQLAIHVGASQVCCFAQEVRRDGFRVLDDSAFAVVRQFYDYDVSLPLRSRLVETIETDHASIEKVVFSTTNDERVPGYFAPPAEAAAPYPCILLVHGLNSSKDWWWDNDPVNRLTQKLLDNGFAVFSIDLQFHGERSVQNDYQSPMYMTFENTLFVRNRNMLIQSTIDCRRALDYLKTRNDIDPVRIGVVGYSMGAMIALDLSVLEPEIAAAVGCATPSHPQLLPADHYNFAARTRVPTALLAGTRDWHTSEEDTRLLFDLIPGVEKDLVFFDSGHQLPAEYTAHAFEWIKSHVQ